MTITRSPLIAGSQPLPDMADGHLVETPVDGRPHGPQDPEEAVTLLPHQRDGLRAEPATAASAQSAARSDRVLDAADATA
ncbi:hypothetical protein AB4212_00335 [Streptomyces sp. 2MCAF27]